MTDLLETMFPTVGDVLSALTIAGLAAGALWVSVTGARELEPDEPEPDRPLRTSSSLVRVLDPSPYDWQHETDL